METARLQYIRRVNLFATDSAGSGLDLEGLRIKFKVQKNDLQTPNNAEMTIYNMAPETVQRIKKEFTRVILQAGYDANYGVIFDGNIKQAAESRESGTDTYLFIAAGDGDVAYNFAVVNGTLSAGSTQRDQIDFAGVSMRQTGGVQVGHIDTIDDQPLPRGKVMYGPARDYVRQSARTAGASWSVQDGKLQVVKHTEILPGEAVLLNSKTGLVGQPKQTENGIEVRCLLNPMLRIGARVKIDEKDIQRALLPATKPGEAVNTPPSISKDGVYKVIAIDHTGDTHGNDWYSNLVCIDIDETAPAGKKVKANE